MLDAAGLKIEVSYSPNVEVSRGVFSQSIVAGETVELGKVIIISIGTGAEPTAPPPTQASTEAPTTPEPTTPQSTTPADTTPVDTTPAANDTPAGAVNN